MTFVEPAYDWKRGQTPAEHLADALEEATDIYAQRCNETAEAENAYLKRYATEFLHADVAATIRPKTAECLSVEERAVWNVRVAAEKAARAKVEELKNRLVAALGHQRWIREQT